jgi:Ca2+-binding EF-hand superfamily protein
MSAEEAPSSAPSSVLRLLTAAAELDVPSDLSAMAETTDEADDAFEELLAMRDMAFAQPAEDAMLALKTTRPHRARSAQPAAGDLDVASHLVRVAARSLVIDSKAQRVPTVADVEALAEALLDLESDRRPDGTFVGLSRQLNATLDYEQYCNVRSTMERVAPRLVPLLGPRLMLHLPRDERGEVLSQAVLQFIAAQTVLQRARVDVASYDRSGSGSLREKDLEAFVSEIRGEIPSGKDLSEGFYPFYVHTVVRAWMFSLDTTGSSSIPLEQLVGSPLFAQFAVHWLCRHRGPEAPGEDIRTPTEVARWALNEGLMRGVPNSEGAANWFSVDNCVRLYRAYLELDQDKDGLLNPAELKRFQHQSVSARFVDRLFQTRYTFSGQMDFRGFLDLNLAIEFTKDPQSVRYFLGVLDLDAKGYLSPSDVLYYFAELGPRLATSTGAAPIPPEFFLTEWTDMVGPAVSDRVTLKDLARCKMGHSAVRMLTDVQALWAFDMRESLSQQAAVDSPEELL